MADTPTVLFIAYHFPPHGGPGVQPNAKLVKYLAVHGWRSLVVTASADANPIQDPSLSRDVPPDTVVVRVPGFSIMRLNMRARRYRLSKLAGALNLLLQLPDSERIWARNVCKVLPRILHAQRPAVICTSAPPFSSHLVGLWLRQRFVLPWFADFRDPWSDNLVIRYPPGYRWLNRRLERPVLAAADRVACVSELWLDGLRRNLGRQPDKFVVVPNGYDDDDVRSHGPPRTARFTLTHLGSFYPNRKPGQVIAAVQRLVASGRLPASQCRVRFVGIDAPLHVPAAPPFEAHAYVPHAELDRFREETNVLLLLLATQPENAGNLSGKIYEYLATNRPILAVGPRGGEAERLIERTRTGELVGGDVDELAAAIERWYQRWRHGACTCDPDWDVIRQFTWRRIAGQLAAELTGLSGGNRAGD